MLSAEKTPYNNLTDTDKFLGTCMVCKEKKDQGIHILTKFICTDCEADMVKTETNDERYLHYVQSMRSLWLDPIWEETNKNNNEK